MKYKIDFNNGLGISPASLFVNIDEKIKLFDVIDTIREKDCADIIIYGDLEQNLNELKLLTSSLIVDRYHISIIIPEINNDSFLQELRANRLIVFFDSDVNNSTNFKHRIKLLKLLSKNDLIVLHPTSIKEFLFTRQYLINSEINAEILLKDSSKVSKEDLLSNKIYDVDIYYGDFYK